MKKMEEKALKYIKKNKNAVDYVQTILISNSLILALLVTDYITNITIDDIFILVCSILIAVGTIIGIIANIIICVRLSKKK